MRAECLNRSIRRRWRASAWVWPSAARSSRHMAGDSGLLLTMGRVVASTSRCRLMRELKVNPEKPIVFAVDDDVSMREALFRLFRSIGMRAEIFASAQEFLRFKRPNARACLVLDGRLRGLSGLDLQRELGVAGFPIPITFITGHGDIPMSVE